MYRKRRDFEIITDSSADLTEQMRKELEVDVVSLSATIGGKTYKDHPNEEYISRREFYKLLREKKVGTTSAPNVLDFKSKFENIILSGKDVLYIGFSSALSSTFQNAKIAANELKSLYPENKILLCDSLCASLGQGALVYYAAKMKGSGYSLEETHSFVENKKLCICHFFTVDTLEYLQRGGRIPKFVAIAGAVLNIKPIMHVDDYGKLTKIGSVRGRGNSIKELADKAIDGVRSSEFNDVFIVHGDCIEDAITLREIIKKSIRPKNIFVSTVGPVIGSHSGPGTLAVFFAGSKR